MYDYLIIGAGICGTLIARELSRYEAKTVVVDKESDVGNHATLANSAIVHSGHDPLEGTLKAKFAVEGNRLYHTLAKELDIPLRKTGGFLLANRQDDAKGLETLYRRAVANGVDSPSLLDASTAKEREPMLHDDIVAALDLPSTMVTYPWEVAIAAMQNAMKNGAALRLNYEVASIKRTEEGFVVTSADGDSLRTKVVINAAGTFADTIASMVEREVPYRITPSRGEYYVLDKLVDGFVERVLYPLPNNNGKGVLVVPQVHGNILLGPTNTHQTDKENVANHAEDLDKIKRDAARMAKDIPFDMTIRTFAGIRASSTYEDFYIEPSKEVPGFYHVAGIDSPGLTAAPAIAEHVVGKLLKVRELYPKKSTFDPYRRKKKAFHTLSDDEQRRMIEADPAHAYIVCKCERVTAAEVKAAIEGPLGSATVKGVKKRARAGSGLCQGGYCESEVLKVIAEVTGKKPHEIDYYRKNTPILKEETKVKR